MTVSDILIVLARAPGGAACAPTTRFAADRRHDDHDHAVAVQEVAPGDDLYALAEDFEPGEPGEVIAVQPIGGLDLRGHGAGACCTTPSRSRATTSPCRGLHRRARGRRARRGRPAGALLGARHDRASPTSARRARSPTAPASSSPARSSSGAWSSSPPTTRASARPGRHPYIAGESEGRGTLDIARAARNLGELTGASRPGRALGSLPGRPRGPVRQPDRADVGARARHRRHGRRRAAVAARR